jgi:hypothetical protein
VTLWVTVTAERIGTAYASAGTQPEDHRIALVERRGCRDRDAATSAAGAVEALRHSAQEQPISVTVPAVALLRVDVDGRVVAAATNTGCAPRTSDAVYLFHEDGSIEAVSAAALAGQVWIGDFTKSGVFAAQPAS